MQPILQAHIPLALQPRFPGSCNVNRVNAEFTAWDLSKFEK